MTTDLRILSIIIVIAMGLAIGLLLRVSNDLHILRETLCPEERPVQHSIYYPDRKDVEASLL